MLPFTARLLRSRATTSVGLKDTERLGLWHISGRTFRVDAPDKEPREEGESDHHMCSTSALEGSSTATASPSGVQRVLPGISTLARARSPGTDPVRVPQQRTGVHRKKVLPPGDNAFMSNVATLLVRWPHAPMAKMPRTWKEVTENERFQYLFPRRPVPLTEQALRGLQALAMSEALEGGPGAGGSSDAGPVPGSPSDPRAAVLAELVDRLQAVQQHLQNSLADDSSENATIVAVAAFSPEDNGDDDMMCSTSEEQDSDDDDEPGRHGGRTHWRKGPNGAAVVTRGRRTKVPTGRERGRAPAPPWDDSQPFQTHVGTVYHFWRLCPYG